MTARSFFVAALLVGLGGAAISASYADEPPTRISHIGIIAGTPRSDPAHIAFEDRLRQLGYVEGRNLTIDFVHIGRGALKLVSIVRRVGHQNPRLDPPPADTHHRKADRSCRNWPGACNGAIQLS